MVKYFALIILSMFVTAQSMEKNVPKKNRNDKIDYISQMPNVIKIVLAKSLVNSNHIEDAGKSLHALQQVNKQWKNFIDDETKYLIDWYSRVYKTPWMVTALYFGTKKARDYEQNHRKGHGHSKELLEIGDLRALKHSLQLIDLKSKISKKIICHFSDHLILCEDECWCTLSNKKTLMAYKVRDYEMREFFRIRIRRKNQDDSTDAVFSEMDIPGSEIMVFVNGNEILYHTVSYNENKKIYRVLQAKEDDLKKYKFSKQLKTKETSSKTCVLS